MTQDLTTSIRDRQNILNNHYAISKIESHLAIGGSLFEGETVFTKEQVAQLLEIDDRTIERYLSTHSDELQQSGYRLLKGNILKLFKLYHVSDIHVGDKSPALGIFSFRALLNIAMLLTESERAKAIRSRILDIVIDVIAEKSGGHTKYINQRDLDYLPAAVQEFNYRQTFTEALRNYLDMGDAKYALYMDEIYKAIFRENASEYRKILKLAEEEHPHETFYAEVLRAISSFENGIATEMKNFYEGNKRKILPQELNEIIAGAESSPYLHPILEDARRKMSSRDLCFREVLHKTLEAYVQTVPEGDFERFLGKTSQSLEERLSDPETLAVFKRLRDR